MVSLPREPLSREQRKEQLTIRDLWETLKVLLKETHQKEQLRGLLKVLLMVSLPAVLLKDPPRVLPPENLPAVQEELPKAHPPAVLLLERAAVEDPEEKVRAA